MTGNPEHWRRMIDGLRSGDQRIITDFCNHYGVLMHQLAERHLAKGLRRRVGPEDVAQSACRTFLRRARGGEFTLDDRDDLWRLLCAITLTKVREQARYHLRQKRGVNQEMGLAPPSGDESSGAAASFGPADDSPSPAEEAEFDDQFRHLVASLDDEERQLVYLKMDECTNEEAAKVLGCSERTVRRLLKQVQARLARVLEESRE